MARTRLALAWPYSGGNLGDSAIVGAAISNLRLVLPGADIVGISLHPASVRDRHGIEGTALAAVSMEFYGSGRWNLDGGTLPAFWSLGNLKRSIRKCRAAVAFVVREIFHWLYAIIYVRRLDGLIFPGSGQFDDEWGGPWGHPYAMFKWSAAARLMGVKVVVMSVGVCHLDSRLGRWFSSRTLQLAQYASLRDPWSQEFARVELRVAPPIVVPDLAFSLETGLPDGSIPPNSGLLKIGVSPIAYGHPEMWPRPDVPTFEAYVDVLAGFVQRMLEEGHAVTLFNTDSPDISVSELVRQRVQTALPAATLASLEIVAAHYLPEVLELIQRLDLVVASRLHGVILSHVCGKPVLAISYDRKVTTHMAQIGQPYACVPLRGVTPDSVAKAFDHMRPQLSALALEVRAVRDRWRGQVLQQYRDVAKLIAP